MLVLDLQVEDSGSGGGVRAPGSDGDLPLLWGVELAVVVVVEHGSGHHVEALVQEGVPPQQRVLDEGPDLCNSGTAAEPQRPRRRLRSATLTLERGVHGHHVAQQQSVVPLLRRHVQTWNRHKPGGGLQEPRPSPTAPETR